MHLNHQKKKGKKRKKENKEKERKKKEKRNTSGKAKQTHDLELGRTYSVCEVTSVFSQLGCAEVATRT